MEGWQSRLCMSCTRVHEQKAVCVNSAGLGAIDWTVCHGEETAGSRGTTTASFYCTYSIYSSSGSGISGSGIQPEAAAAAVSLPSCQLARPSFCSWQEFAPFFGTWQPSVSGGGVSGEGSNMMSDTLTAVSGRWPASSCTAGQTDGSIDCSIALCLCRFCHRLWQSP